MQKLFLADEKGNRATKDDFAYIKEGKDNIPLNLVNDVERYQELVESLNGDLSFTEQEQETIWKIVGAILHLGNVELDTAAYDQAKSNKRLLINRLK